jgi:hypothetical protein
LKTFPELEEILNRFVLGKEATELNEELMIYCVQGFKKFVADERLRLTSNLLAKTVAMDITTMMDGLKKKIHDFYAKFAELETKNIRRGIHVFSKLQGKEGEQSNTKKRVRNVQDD